MRCSVKHPQRPPSRDIIEFSRRGGIKGGDLPNKKGVIMHSWRDGKKVCPQCLDEKAKAEYYRCGNGQFMSWCKACCKRLRPQNLDYFKQYYQVNKEKRKSQDRERRYGVTQEEFDFVWEMQGEVCGICGVDTPGGKGGWHTDHDHDTGQFRGILCNKCNALVNERNTQDILRKAIDYLDANQVVEVT